MNENKEMTEQQAKSTQQPHEQESVLRPAVDIFEDETGITVQADMPGVSHERLDVHIDNDSLSIVGHVEIPVPEGMEAMHADMRSKRYERSFSLSRELDGENIEASLKHGVLTLRIPKREEHKPRKIEVQAG